MMDKQKIAIDLASIFRQACYADVQAFKPGNVSIHSASHQMEYKDFIISADACAEALCATDTSLGDRIVNSVKATQKVVDKNTNLGIVLLCAPLIHSMCLREVDEPLRNALRRTLQQTTVDDTVKVYQAIQLSKAGNLGKVGEADISEKPTINLQRAMYLAQHRDLLAKQYTNDYQQIFEYMTPQFLAFLARWGYSDCPVTGIYLMLLAGYPDSLVIRKFGEERAKRLQDDMKSLYQEFSNTENPEKFKSILSAIDKDLKEERVNPGTTADMTVAAILVSDLENYINQNKELN